MILVPIASVLVLTLLAVVALSLVGRNRINMSDSIALAIIGVFVAMVSFALIEQEGFPFSDLFRRPKKKIEQVSPKVKVWVDSQTGLYYCNGSKQFGHTDRGHYSTQQSALTDYYKSATGQPCQ